MCSGLLDEIIDITDNGGNAWIDREGPDAKKSGPFEGLARARARGKKLGGENAQSRKTAAEAAERAEALRPVIEKIRSEAPDMSANAIAVELNRQRIATPTKGAKWHAQSVIRVLDRLDRVPA
jgi:hypothetical protein